MTRDPPLEPPGDEEVAAAVSGALEVRVEAVSPIEEGLNATYRVDLADGRRGVLKVATYATDDAELAEAAVLAHLDDHASVPVPPVMATLPPAESPLPGAAHLTEYREGRQIPDLLDLPAPARERLAREAGRHLAAVHGCPAPDGFGPVRAADGSLAVPDPAASWADRFATLAGDAVDGLRGGGVLTDDEGRFGDLAPAVADALAGFEDIPRADGVDPALLHADYRPANLLLGPDDAAPLTRTVLDVGAETGDPLLDVALAEDALVDVPLGGTDEATRLRTALRRSYADARGRPRSALFDARYPYYRLLVRSRWLGAFDYWQQFVREDDPGAAADRWRSFVSARLEEVDG